MNSGGFGEWGSPALFQYIYLIVALSPPPPLPSLGIKYDVDFRPSASNGHSPASLERFSLMDFPSRSALSTLAAEEALGGGLVFAGGLLSDAARRPQRVPAAVPVRGAAAVLRGAQPHRGAPQPVRPAGLVPALQQPLGAARRPVHGVNAAHVALSGSQSHLLGAGGRLSETGAELRNSP